MFRVTQALYAAASKTAATATVRAVKRSRLIPTRAALTLVRETIYYTQFFYERTALKLD